MIVDIIKINTLSSNKMYTYNRSTVTYLIVVLSHWDQFVYIHYWAFIKLTFWSIKVKCYNR